MLCISSRISRLMKIGSRYFPRMLHQERTLSSINQSQPLSHPMVKFIKCIF
ncbi:hypothetical protein Lalb_Chr04g0250671 [Lupinus albus]|uniref:Uncharacterized protein n=1 Tax=Lupinus albus TaxID=3870 RepID=A0A6A4QMY1_LUPAL|nr:hypothetical protein Lalb_Chr04g0250671 [Lupinus albus]